MATVKIILKKNLPNSKNEYPLRIRLTHERKVKEITIDGGRVKLNKWDSKKLRVKGDKTLNLRLDTLLGKYKDALNQLLIINKPFELSDVIGIVSENKKITDNRYHEKSLVADYIQNCIITNHDLAYSTRKNYKTLMYFIIDNYKKMKLGDVCGDLMNTIERNMKELGLKQNTIHTRLKCLKATVNRAYNDRFISKPDFRGFKLVRGYAKRTYLNLDETKLLLNHLGSMETCSLDYNILRSFLWSCYSTGMRFGDVCTLTYKQLSIENNAQVRIIYKMRKTKKVINAIINKTSIRLIEQSKIDTNDMVFDLLDKSLLNLDRDRLTTKISSRNAYVNKRLKIIASKAGLTKKIHFHMSRRSFCTNCLAKGISELIIRDIAGVSLKVLASTYGIIVDKLKIDALKLLDE